MKAVAKENLVQLKEMLQSINNENYTRQNEILSGSSVGQHIRHILEFYLLLVSGSFSGTISYDKRQRDIRIEKDQQFAIQTIDRLLQGIDTLDETLAVKFEGDFTADGTAQNSTLSSVGRELAYCIEHSIHHQAIIKAGLIVLGLSELTNENFGVAYSTIRYREN
ncbi:MAG: DinB family protein [Prolixibacteraceae bacterium]|nr:DinB family protein [Prolixibacteraceae bacterium]